MKDKTLCILFFCFGVSFSVLSAVLGVGITEMQGESGKELLSLALAVVLALVSIIYFIGYIFGWMIQFRAWKRIQILKREDPAKYGTMPLPALAVWLQFIPLFNWYWYFVSFASLWKYVEALRKRQGGTDDEWVARWTGIWFGVVNILLQLSSFICFAVAFFVGFKAVMGGMPGDRIMAVLMKAQQPYLYTSFVFLLLFIALFSCQITFMYRFLRNSEVADIKSND